MFTGVYSTIHYYVLTIVYFTVPEAPGALKSILLSSSMAYIAWLPPKHPNGQIQHYTLYEREVFTNKFNIILWKIKHINHYFFYKLLIKTIQLISIQIIHYFL